MSGLRGRAFIRSRAEALPSTYCRSDNKYWVLLAANARVYRLRRQKNKTVERREKTMKASRHNGRSGKHGVYDVKHNDRDFYVEHREHID